jgi:CheY-like chemotaxis protein
MDGREVLAHIKQDASLKLIPTVILTTSNADANIVGSYQLQANCYLTKPVQLEVFESLVKSINDFWPDSGQAATDGNQLSTSQAIQVPVCAVRSFDNPSPICTILRISDSSSTYRTASEECHAVHNDMAATAATQNRLRSNAEIGFRGERCATKSAMSSAVTAAIVRPMWWCPIA